jgi:hypothetical protein
MGMDALSKVYELPVRDSSGKKVLTKMTGLEIWRRYGRHLYRKYTLTAYDGSGGQIQLTMTGLEWFRWIENTTIMTVLASQKIEGESVDGVEENLELLRSRNPAHMVECLADFLQSCRLHR